MMVPMAIGQIYHRKQQHVEISVTLDAISRRILAPNNVTTPVIVTSIHDMTSAARSIQLTLNAITDVRRVKKSVSPVVDTTLVS